jgi:hypothetical protein
VNPFANILLSAVPEIPALIQAFIAAHKAVPAISGADLIAMLQEVTAQPDGTFDSVLAKIAADKAAHPGA